MAHLTNDQRATIVRTAKAALEEEARWRRLANLKGGSRVGETAHPGAEAPSTFPKTGRVRKQLAKLAGVSEYKIRQAAEVQKKAPELAEAVKRGDLKLAEARRLADAPASASGNGGLGTVPINSATPEAILRRRAQTVLEHLRHLPEPAVLIDASGPDLRELDSVVGWLAPWVEEMRRELEARHREAPS